VSSNDVWIAADGTGWLHTAFVLASVPVSDGGALPTVRRVSTTVYDIDLKDGDATWSLVLGDGTAFTPTKRYFRVHAFDDCSGTPSDALPTQFRGLPA
jgi:hypothetical protein